MDVAHKCIFLNVYFWMLNNSFSLKILFHKIDRIWEDKNKKHNIENLVGDNVYALVLTRLHTFAYVHAVTAWLQRINTI